jgi:hypothetical protein
MGLDMYLNKKKYMGWNYEHRREGSLPDLSQYGINSHKVTYVEEQVAYWRKANAIHKWFVDNCQDGIDECQRSKTIEKEQMVELLELVNAVLLQPSCAENTLPSTSGFFFGGTDYDQYYMEDMKNTKEILEDVIKNWDEDAEYFYQSSW